MFLMATPGTGSAAPVPRPRTASWSPGRSRRSVSWVKAAMTRPPSPRLPTTTPVRPAAAPVLTVTGFPMQAWAASA